MKMNWKRSVFLVRSSDEKNKGCGTAFVVFRGDCRTWLLTCAHVVEAVGGKDYVSVEGEPATVVTHSKEALEGPDLAVLMVEKRVDPPSLPLTACTDTGEPFIIPGCQPFKSKYLIRSLRGKLGTQIDILGCGPDAGRHIAWDLIIEGDFSLKPGYSGSPVVHEKSGEVLGVASDSFGKGEKGIAVSVSALLDVWPEMPAELKQNLTTGIDAPDSVKVYSAEKKTCIDVKTLTPPGGAISADSPFYIRRKADDAVNAEIQLQRAMVVIRGPRQTGKTSLLVRAFMQTRGSDAEMRGAFFDFQCLPGAHFETVDGVWKAIVDGAAAQLCLDGWRPDGWDPAAGFDRNLNKFMDQFVFGRDQTPVLFCLDEADRLFSFPSKTDFFGSLRALYNRGAFDPSWQKVRWLLSTSSEPRFFIEDITQSPFNIGLQEEIGPFTAEEVDIMARRHGFSPTSVQIEAVMDFLGGRPYLVHLFFYKAVLQGKGFEEFIDPETAGNGIFLDHVNGYLKHFQETPDLARAMRRVIDGRGCDDVKLADRLASAGLVRRNADGRVVCFCALYAACLGKEL